MRTHRQPTVPILVWAALGAVGAMPAAAQQRERPWKATARLQGEFRYDDNPFLLTAGRKRGLEQPSAADSQSGWFRDMESATDLVPVPALELGLEGPGVLGRTLAIEAKAAYEANLENARRRHAELGLRIAQSLSRGGRLRFGADWRPSYFHKNYLEDAIDFTGDVDASERRYAAGASNEVDLSLNYRHRLVKSGKRRPLGVTGELEVGYFDRTYDAPFAGRSRRGPGAGVALALDLGRDWGIELEYSYASLGADVTTEVLILNENDFSQDFNGNGSVSEDSARAAVAVDRSRDEQQLGVALEGALSRGVTAAVAYRRRTRDFSSTEPFDVVNQDRDDTLNEFSAELDLRLASGLHLILAGRRAVQRTNRAGDPGSTGDVADYTRHVASAGLGYRF